MWLLNGCFIEWRQLDAWWPLTVVQVSGVEVVVVVVGEIGNSVGGNLSTL
jgi:hypothetical protein